uniref:Uncharacterized protein n=1 Tax=Knipowitschia caucasica TaxID=637954 RepID=A0AAV2JJ16_KNICA
MVVDDGGGLVGAFDRKICGVWGALGARAGVDWRGGGCVDVWVGEGGGGWVAGACVWADGWRACGTVGEGRGWIGPVRARRGWVGAGWYRGWGEIEEARRVWSGCGGVGCKWVEGRRKAGVMGGDRCLDERGLRGCRGGCGLGENGVGWGGRRLGCGGAWKGGCGGVLLLVGGVGEVWVDHGGLLVG